MRTKGRPRLKKRTLELLSKKSENTEQKEWELWEPFPVQQKLINCDAFLVGFGGSGGGSKTAGVILDAYKRHKKSLILRKTYPNLKEIVERSREIFSGSGGSYSSIDKLWRFPDGKLIELGTLQYAHDRENYRGREHSGLFIDEATEIPGGWETIRFLSGWCRDPNPDQICQIVLTFNPPSTPEGEWIKQVFAPWIDPEHENPAESGEVRWFATIGNEDVEVDGPESFEDEDGDIIEPRSRTFIRATLDDNPALSKTGYRQTLKSLPEPLRSQLLYGDMSIQVEDDPWQVIPSAWVEAAFQRWQDIHGTIANRTLTSIGVDVARGGKDQTIIAMLYENVYDKLLEYPGTTTPDGGSVAAQIMKHYVGCPQINIDVVGVGSSVYDHMHGIPKVFGISSGSGSTETDETGLLSFYNLRSEIWWSFREALNPENGWGVALPRDGNLKAELCAPRWKVVTPSAEDTKYSRKGRIQVESKDETKKTIGRSPDRADAVIYAWYQPKDISKTFIQNTARWS